MSSSPPLSVGLVSLGCSKNLVDTQVMCGVLLTEEVELAPNPDEADVVLINTCAFIEPAREEAYAEIDRACALKKKRQIGAVVVAGCLPQRYGEKLVDRFPGVDAWLGIDHLEDIADIVKQAAAAGARRRRQTILDLSSPATSLYEPRIPNLSITGGPFAYLKIAEGCNHACAFCAIPGIRGHLRSRPLDAIVGEARALLESGVRELNVVAQDVTAYGRDHRGAPRLPALLRALDQLPGDFWIRILYGYPAYVDDDLLDCFRTLKHLCKYIDIPVQHSHPDILKAMRRPDTAKPVATLPKRLREAIPDVTLRTTCLVGFPGETDEHFAHLLDYVEEAQFDNLGVFVFSPEEGTHAVTLPGPVPAEVAEKRRDRLMRLQKKVVAGRNALRVGKGADLLLLRQIRGGRWEGRLAGQAPDVDGITIVSGVPKGAKPGDFLRVSIEGVSGYDFRATVAENSASPV